MSDIGWKGGKKDNMQDLTSVSHCINPLSSSQGLPARLIKTPIFSQRYMLQKLSTYKFENFLVSGFQGGRAQIYLLITRFCESCRGQVLHIPCSLSCDAHAMTQTSADKIQHLDLTFSGFRRCFLHALLISGIMLL